MEAMRAEREAKGERKSRAQQDEWQRCPQCKKTPGWRRDDDGTFKVLASG